jgi:hypothetical protein
MFAQAEAFAIDNSDLRRHFQGIDVPDFTGLHQNNAMCMDLVCQHQRQRVGGSSPTFGRPKRIGWQAT